MQRLKHGFSLIELMVVIVIIAILAGLISAAAVSSGNTARRAQAETDINGLYKAYAEYKFKYGEYPDNPDSGANKMTFNITAKTGLIYVLSDEVADVYSFDRSQVKNNDFCDPWGEAYVWVDSATKPKGTGNASAPDDLVGLPSKTSGNKVYIYSLGGGDATDQEDWVYKK